MEEGQYKKLWWDIILATLGFSMIPLLILGIVIYQQFSSSHTAIIMEDLKTLAENRAASIDFFFEERVSQISGLANTHSLKMLENEDYLHQVFNVIQSRSKSYLDLGVIDQEGNHLAYVGPYHDILKSVNYKNEEWFHQVMSTGVYVSDVFLGFRKVPHFIIAVLVLEKNQSWILRATIDSNIIDNILQAAWVGKHGDAFIINRDNILQTVSRSSGKLLEQPRTPDFAAATGNQVEMVGNGVDYLFATSLIKLKKWVLVLKEDPKEHLTPLLQARFITGLIVLGGLLLIAGGAVLTTRAMMKELLRVERKRATSDEMLLQSHKMAALGKMAAGIAHEINNPLAVIGEKAGWVKDLLKMEDISKSANFQEFAEAMNKIEHHIIRAKTITHRLLGFARRLEPVVQPVNINGVLEESVSLLEHEARYRNIDIRVDYTPDLPTIESDAAQLTQVFLNILNNAIDAIGKNGEINIRTNLISKTNTISVEFADNGGGIPKGALNKIFDPFFTTKGVGDGTGLGLSISYSIMEKLGGRMMVASEEGKGTTFTIYLPGA